jgi:hypothetical protein
VIRVFLDLGHAQPGTSADTNVETNSGSNADTSQVPAVRQAEQLAIALTPLVEAAVAPFRAELADTRAALENAHQELGAALEHAVPVERERDDLLQTTIAQAERIGRLEAALAAARKPWWRIW